MHVSNASGNSAGQTLQDAWGNSLADAGGLFGDTPGLDREDWHHNTKEYDGNTGLVYMYQRWYLPETGTFVSQAPYEPSIEHQYSAYASSPASRVDPNGMVHWLPGKPYIPILDEVCTVTVLHFAIPKHSPKHGADDKMMHCIISCELANLCSKSACMHAGLGGEILDDIGKKIGTQNYGADYWDMIANEMGCISGSDGRCGSCEDKCQEHRNNGTLPPVGF